MDEPKPGRFGYEHIEAQIARLRQEAAHPAELDRRRVLARLCRAFDAEEPLLLLRGFDRAYRRSG
jgi:hypothetical protein